MKKVLFFTVMLAVLAFGALSAQYQEIYSQPYPGYDAGVPGSDQAWTSTLNTAQSIDYRFADNFSGLSAPITKITAYGVASNWNGDWVAAEPAATEPFNVRFYNYTGSWTQPPQPLTAEITGTYTVNLYDSYGDSWNGGQLDVLVNGVVVLDDITLASGGGPEAYTFTANAGDLITTIFTAGSWAHENWYEILDPNNTVIATDGENGEVPTGIDVNPLSEPLTVEIAGTYTVNLYDDYGDGWDTSKLSVYVNGVVVLEDITLAEGAGPLAYTFTANAGDEITTIFTSGSWPDENWYEIVDPNNAVIATDGPGPQGIGFISTYEINEPEWSNPAEEFLNISATTTFIAQTDLAGTAGLYRYDIVLPGDVNMAEGWVSVQASIDAGAAAWFLWVKCDAAYGDGSSWQYAPTKSRNTPNNAYVTNGSVRDQKNADVAFFLYTGTEPAYITVPGPESTPGGTMPDELLGDDTDVPAVIYTVVSTGTRDVIVNKPAQFTGEWYCWIKAGNVLLAADNPIPADTPSWTFNDVIFSSKAHVKVIIDDQNKETPTLPVELSSFSATLTAQNYVKLNWVSQSETMLLGYRVYRNTSNDQANAILITPSLINATNTSTTQSYSLTDDEVSIGNTYWYWLESVDYSSSQFHGPVSVNVEGELPPVIPTVTTLRNAYPNPFKADNSTTIVVDVKADDAGTVSIYNILGQVVKTYPVTAGTNTLNWNGRDSRGNVCGSGLYFYKLSTPSTNQTKKMVIVK